MTTAEEQPAATRGDLPQPAANRRTPRGRVVMVTGGHEETGQGFVDAVLDELWRSTPGVLTIMHQDIRGAAACAHAWALGMRARGYGVRVERRRADRKRDGESATLQRNRAMISSGRPELCLVFAGTAGGADAENLVRQCRKLGVRIQEVG